MKTVLILSSYVASSHVGGAASQFCLQSLGIETVLLPTTLYGRHPGWGAPGGEPLPEYPLLSMWEAVKRQNITFDAVLTGYLAFPEHIDLAREIIDDVRSINPDAMIVVDPVMGDHGKLYIPEDMATAMCTELLPKADLITPNVWEYEFIQSSGHEQSWTSTLVTSIETDHGEIGARYSSGDGDWQAMHQKFDDTPHGSGDCLAALFLGHLICGKSPNIALDHALSSVFAMLSHAQTHNLHELPLIECSNSLTSASTLQSQKV